MRVASRRLTLLDGSRQLANVRFAPKSGHVQRTSPCRLCAKSGRAWATSFAKPACAYVLVRSTAGQCELGQNPDTDDVYERDEINNRPPLTVADAVENSGYRDSQDHNEKNKNQPMPNAQRPHVSPPTSTHTIQRTIEDENCLHFAKTGEGHTGSRQRSASAGVRHLISALPLKADMCGATRDVR